MLVFNRFNTTENAAIILANGLSTEMQIFLYHGLSVALNNHYNSIIDY